MKTLSGVSMAILLIAIVNPEGIYDYSVPKIEGGNQLLSDYQGKTMMIVTLPLQQTASADSFLYSLDTLGAAHVNDVKIIAVPAYEDGYTPAGKEQLELWYRSKLGSHIIVTDGLYTRKTSGMQQHALFNWLTDISKNENFDTDVEGENYKFFVGSTGRLYGVLKSRTKIWGSAVQKTLGMQ